MRYIVGVLNYGGKLTHQEDQSILIRQVKTFLHRRVFEDAGRPASMYERAVAMLDDDAAAVPYDLTGTQSDPMAEPNQLGERTFQIYEAGLRVRGYWMPAALNDLRAMKEHVRESFPLEDAPAVFGLHHNATIRSCLSMAETIMKRTYTYQFVIKRPKQPALTQQ